jgi:hypothetical protein
MLQPVTIQLQGLLGFASVVELLGLGDQILGGHGGVVNHQSGLGCHAVFLEVNKCSGICKIDAKLN